MTNIRQDRIAKHCGDLKNRVVIEVGPGPGSLTRSIINAGARRVIAVEKDQRFFPALQMIGQAVDEAKEYQKFNLIHGDILQVQELDLLKAFGEDSCEGVTLVGNLPFGVATPLLIKWLRDINSGSGIFSKMSNGTKRDVNMVLMFQQEVVDRIVAQPQTADYGRISVVSQYHCDVKKLFTIKGKTFIPPPKVDAGVVMMKPKAKLPEPYLPMLDLEQFCKLLFHARRKQVNSNLRTFLSAEHVAMVVNLAELPRSILDLRPQDLPVEQIRKLAYAYSTLCAKLNIQVNIEEFS